MSTIMDVTTLPMPAAIDPQLDAFVNAVNLLAATPGKLEEALSPAAKQAPVRKPKAVKKPVSKSHNVATKNGGSMDSRPGTITKGQLAKLITLCDSMGEPLDAAELKVIKGYSMAQASDYRYDLLND